MRPLLLSFAGIRSYPGAVGPLDFTGKRRIAILGDTGAGKSTILEVISLGLYGNCTWTEGHKALMAEGATQMSVDFTFFHDGQRWRVRRVFHANTTPATHLLQNLDTGEQIDGARAVNHRIVTLLQLRFDSFKTAVLLPQGHFDRLLTAPGGMRTTLLKGIFGGEVIEKVRDRADRHRDQLTELIHQAERSRLRLLDNPAATASQAAEDAGQAERLAEHLDQALTSLRACREQAFASRARHKELTATSVILPRHKKMDVTGELARIGEASDDLASLEAAADQAEKDCRDQKAKADAQLAAAAREGLTAESLASAGTLLDGMPGQLAELAADQAQLDSDTRDIAMQAQQLEAEETRLIELDAIARSLAEARTAADSTLGAYRDACGRLNDSTGTALLEAVSAGQAQREEEQAHRRLHDRREAVTSVEAAADTAAAQLQAADERLSEIRGHDSAHTAGAGLSPGEACLICRRPLPDDYQPPAPADPHALQAAEKASSKAKKADKDATGKLAQARADAASADKDYAARQSAARLAQTRLERAKNAAAAAMRDLAQDQWGDGTQSPGEQEFEAQLESACSRLANARSDGQAKMRSTSARELLDPARALAKTLADAAADAAGAARNGEYEAARASDMLALQRTAHSQAEARLTTARERHETAQAKLSRDLGELPQLARHEIPGSALAVTSSAVATAKQIITERQGQLNALRRHSETATAELSRLATARRQLDQRRHREVTSPLHALVTHLERWDDVIDQAAGALTGNQLAASMPARLSAITTEQVRAYAQALAMAAATVQDSISSAAITAGNEASAQLRKLDAAAAGLRDGQQGFPAIALAGGEELLDPASLDPVIAGQTSASDAVGRHRASQKAAEEQIEQADMLDTAIRAGQARLSAVSALRTLLGDAKFLQYLTDKRTHALLGVASENFGRLSGGEFGFAEDFQIISSYSGATRSPKTLSGGETFLASLALALALVELHSRSGARLGALFLDEGFGSLDIDALASSLSMLQAETGEDKLVVIISHLHAVAEAVEDVLWVERRPEGSTARWLTASERDALVRQEVTGGLLSLI